MKYKEIEYLENILVGLILNIDLLKIVRKEDEFGVLLTISIGKEDMGMLIGKGGNTIKSIRTIIRLYGLRIGKKINLKVLD